MSDCLSHLRIYSKQLQRLSGRAFVSHAVDRFRFPSVTDLTVEPSQVIQDNKFKTKSNQQTKIGITAGSLSSTAKCFAKGFNVKNFR